MVMFVFSFPALFLFLGSAFPFGLFGGQRLLKIVQAVHLYGVWRIPKMEMELGTGIGNWVIRACDQRLKNQEL